MQTEQMVLATEFCLHNNIEINFIITLHESSIIDITKVEEEVFIPVSQLKTIENLLRLQHDLDINTEGIEAISHLLQRMQEMQHELLLLKNKLRKHDITNSDIKKKNINLEVAILKL